MIGEMNLIKIEEPVWNGGKPYLSIRSDRVQGDDVFVRSTYKDKHQNPKFPNMFYIDGNAIRNTPIFKERWGQAYRVYPNDLPVILFYLTICWTIEGEDNEVTLIRSNYDDLLECAIESLEKYKARKPYIECAAAESTDGQYGADLTEILINKTGAV